MRIMKIWIIRHLHIQAAPHYLAQGHPVQQLWKIKIRMITNLMKNENNKEDKDEDAEDNNEDDD